MGQQQLLLLVLATVIVGLATVAGIQAFDEGQATATQDALVQRGLDIGNKVLAAHGKPTQFGGTNLGSSDEGTGTIATAAGFDTDSGIAADGAGDNAECDITTHSPGEGENGQVTINCGSTGAESGDQQVTITVNPDDDDQITAEIDDTSGS
jgi:hypothetical protein